MATGIIAYKHIKYLDFLKYRGTSGSLMDYILHEAYLMINAAVNRIIKCNYYNKEVY